MPIPLQPCEKELQPLPEPCHWRQGAHCPPTPGLPRNRFLRRATGNPSLEPAATLNLLHIFGGFRVAHSAGFVQSKTEAETWCGPWTQGKNKTRVSQTTDRLMAFSGPSAKPQTSNGHSIAPTIHQSKLSHFDVASHALQLSTVPECLPCR